MQALRALPETRAMTQPFQLAKLEAEPPDGHSQAGAWERELIYAQNETARVRSVCRAKSTRILRGLVFVFPHLLGQGFVHLAEFAAGIVELRAAFRQLIFIRGQRCNPLCPQLLFLRLV